MIPGADRVSSFTFARFSSRHPLAADSHALADLTHMGDDQTHRILSCEPVHQYANNRARDGSRDARRVPAIGPVPPFHRPISQEGNFVVWDANGQPTGQTTILGQSITSIGTATPPTTVRGPIPAASDPGIDSRYIV